MEHDFRPGDVVRYRAAEYHCRESTAIAYDCHGRVVLLDTYWGGGFGDRHALTADEIATAELQFNINDYDELDQYAPSVSAATWAKYASADREVVTSQHGLQKRWFIRKGAAEHWPTQIENARRELEKREGDAEAAQRSVEYAREDLAKVMAAAEAAQAGSPTLPA